MLFRPVIALESQILAADIECNFKPRTRICFDENFTEARTGCVNIKDVDYSDVVTMLEYICPDHNYLRQKKICETNLAALIHCSHRFQIPTLQRELYQYLENELSSDNCSFKPEALADAIAEALSAHFSPKYLAYLYKKFGEHGLEKMEEALKNAPDSLAQSILAEARKYTPVIAQEPVSSSYHWNDFSRRMFF
ncbi:hypothetical protein Q1695_000954 [Nippostrongylus brasiliensis]|nr:hypothetical protein Q1695_000954 [Nippostrongylus brasiliensis]